jgi:hypothetical protein
MCLGFDIPEDPDITQRIDYTPDRLKHALDRDKEMLGIDAEFLRALLRAKAKEWEYEREVRVMADLKHQEANGFYYVDFGDAIKLREVILGARNTSSVGAVAKAVGKPDHPVQVLRARAAFNEFAMVRNKAVAAINIKARS